MTKHTPGPWGCVDTSYHAHDYRLTKPDGTPLPLHIDANDHSEQRANARLIAAAPDLLDAVKEAILQIGYLHAKFSGTGSGEAVLAKCRAAFAKATSNI